MGRMIAGNQKSGSGSGNRSCPTFTGGNPPHTGFWTAFVETNPNEWILSVRGSYKRT
jgi:hypothetical protein